MIELSASKTLLLAAISFGAVSTNVATLYAVPDSTNVTEKSLTVSIPTTFPPAPQGPSGQVANTNSSSFKLGDGSSALFIFANLNGTISTWNSGNESAATTEATIPGASFAGLAINQADTMLYAATDATGAIDVFNGSFVKVNTPGKFVDPRLPKGYVPFNV